MVPYVSVKFSREKSQRGRFQTGVHASLRSLKGTDFFLWGRHKSQGRHTSRGHHRWFLKKLDRQIKWWSETEREREYGKCWKALVDFSANLSRPSYMNFQGAGVSRDLNWSTVVASNSQIQNEKMPIEGVMREWWGSEELESCVDSKTFWNGLFTFCDSSSTLARIYSRPTTGQHFWGKAFKRPFEPILKWSWTNSVKQYIAYLISESNQPRSHHLFGTCCWKKVMEKIGSASDSLRVSLRW